MRERIRVDDPYTKPWVARDAAKNVVKQALASGYTPSELIDQMQGIFRPDYTAVEELLRYCKRRFGNGPRVGFEMCHPTPFPPSWPRPSS